MSDPVVEHAFELKALRRADARYRGVLLASASIVWIASPEGYFTERQPAWEAYTGQTWDDYRHDRWIAAIHPDDRQRVTRDWMGAVASKGPVYRTHGRVWSARHGAWRAFQTRGVPVRDDSGRIVEWIGALTDIQDTVDAQEALSASENRLSAELAAMTRLHALSARLVAHRDIAAALDDVLSSAIATCGENKGNVQRFDVDAATLRIVAHAGFGEEFLQHFREVHVGEGSVCGRALESRRAVVVEDVSTDLEFAAHRDVAARAGYRAVVSAPVVSSAGEVLGMLSLHFARPHRPSPRDLQLLELHTRLAADFLERQQTEAAMRAADRRKDEFLAILAHELRNPLAPIGAAVQVLKLKGPPEPELQWARDVISRQVHQMARLLDDLLDVARITSGKLVLQKSPAELADIVATATEMSLPAIKAAGHQLNVLLPKEPVVLDVDAARMGQVLANLLNNAARYTPAPGRIEVNAEVLDGWLTIRVRDNGLGLSADLLPRLFSLFSQGERSLDRPQAGLGVGLALAKGLVELHGGSIHALSDGPGKGSEFSVRLPLASQRRPEESAARASMPLARRRRVLVVDDSSDAAESIARYLALLGHEVHTAYDGEQGLQAARRLKPDAVLLDVGMPKLDGYEVCRSLRSEFGQAVVLIAITGWGQPAERQRAKDAGFDHHLVKPANLSELVALLQ